jgi:ribosomal protein S18 acetylase RimI-like enzyme
LVAGGVDVVREHFEVLCALYVETFSQPPFHWPDDGPESHEAALVELMGVSTFEAVLAFDDRVLVGFAYGRRLPVDHRWWDGIDRPVPGEAVVEWEGRTFAVVDLAVAARWRGHRVGRMLVETLLSRRVEERFLLTVQPTAARAQAFYVHLGWQLVGRKGPITGVVPSHWDLYVFPPLEAAATDRRR